MIDIGPRSSARYAAELSESPVTLAPDVTAPGDHMTTEFLSQPGVLPNISRRTGRRSSGLPTSASHLPEKPVGASTQGTHRRAVSDPLSTCSSGPHHSPPSKRRQDLDTRLHRLPQQKPPSRLSATNGDPGTERFFAEQELGRSTAHSRYASSNGIQRADTNALSAALKGVAACIP